MTFAAGVHTFTLSPLELPIPAGEVAEEVLFFQTQSFCWVEDYY